MHLLVGFLLAIFCKFCSTDVLPQRPEVQGITSSNTLVDAKVRFDNISLNEWNLTIQIAPFHFACRTDAVIKIPNITKWVCNWAGENCHNITVPDTENRNRNKEMIQLWSDQCDNVGEHCQSDTSGHLIICYESQLDSDAIKPPFQLKNTEGNALADYCQKKALLNPFGMGTWHGVGVNFCITRQKTNPKLLHFNANISFSYVDKIMTMTPKLLKIDEENVFNSVELYLIYDKEQGTTMAIDEDQQTISDLEQTKPHLNQGQFAFQNSAGLWMALFDVKDKQTIVDEQKEMEKFREKERKEVDGILENYFRLKATCKYYESSADEKNYPELENRRHPPPGMTRNRKSGQRRNKRDIMFTKEQAIGKLKTVCKNCELIGKVPECPASWERRKRQVEGNLQLMVRTN